MNASVETMPAMPVNGANAKPLWAAVGVLGVAVLAMGSSLVYMQTRPMDGHTAFATASRTAQAEAPATSKVEIPESLGPQEDLAAPPAKPPVAVVKPVPVKTSAKPVHAVAPAATPSTVAGAGAFPSGNTQPGAPSVVADTGLVVSQHVTPPARPMCANCGTVEAVTPIQRQGSGSGVGVVAGGAVGAVLGNQIGKGGGRTLATILGAVGGGLAGNAIEKNVKKETVYQVRVHMEDGSTRTIEQSTLPSVGAKVTVDGSVMHSASEVH